MPARPYWRGYLKLSLVTCAVTLSPATTQGQKVRFHTLNRQTGDRIHTQYVDAVTGKAVDDDDQTRAYQKAEDDYVILEEDDLDSVQLESARTIDIDEFVEADGGDAGHHADHAREQNEPGLLRQTDADERPLAEYF